MPSLSQNARRALAEERLRARLAAFSSQEPAQAAPAGPAPLSAAQERLWIMHQLDPDSPIAHRPMALRLVGPLQRAVLLRGLNEILRRHAVLRTVYHLRGHGLVQEVMPTGEISFQEYDLRKADEKEFQRFARTEARRPFDLSTGPIVRAVLVQRSDDHVLLLLFHHIAFDGWSAEIFRRELTLLYESYREGRASPLPELPIQYTDFVRWQREQAKAGGEGGQRTYWRQQLAGLPVLEIRGDFRRPGRPLVEGRRHDVALPASLLEQAKAMARREGATLFMVLLASFEVLLYRLTGQVDYGVGVPVAGRSLPEAEPLIGCFINLLVERADLSGDPTFRQLLGRVRRTSLEAFAHQDAPFAEVVEAMRPERRANRAPLAQVFFQLRNMPKHLNASGTGLRIEPLPFDTGVIGGQDLSLEMEETRDGLNTTFLYSTNLFAPDTVARFAEEYRVLFDAALADPDAALSKLPHLTDATVAFGRVEPMVPLPSGKPDRKVTPAPPVRETREALPWTPTERILAEIWATVLHAPKVQREDDFFGLGGHSLLIPRVIWHIKERLGVAVPLASFFNAPTLGALAAVVSREAGRNEAATSIVRLGSRETSEGQPVVVPASFAQRRLWFLEQLEPGTSRYHMAKALRLVGPLHVAALEHALRTVIRRHEPLRTTFTIRDGEPVQVIAPDAQFQLPVETLDQFDAADREVELRRLFGDLVRMPFDLEQGPLLRACIWRLGNDEHVLALVLHHIVSDGWSLSVLGRELKALSRMEPLPDLPVQYADYAVWQRGAVESARIQRQLAYWKEQLDGAPTTELPSDRPRLSPTSHQAGHLSLVLPEDLSERLRALGRREHATLFVVLLAAFYVLLQRYTQQEDLVVGTPVAGRTAVQLEPLIGCFLNTLVLRADLAGNPTFQELITRIRKVALEAQAHQEVPFEKLVELLNPERDLRRAALFQILFNMDNLPEADFAMAGLDVEPVEPPEPEAKFDLTLYARSQHAALRFDLVYNKALFDEGTMQHFLAQYEVLLSQTADSPGQPISTYGLRATVDQTLLPDPRMPIDLPRCETVLSRVRLMAEQSPQATAVEWGDVSLTYASMVGEVDRLAHMLIEAGVGRGCVVALTGVRSPGLVVAMLATWACGGTVLPLDPHLPERRRRQMMREARAAFLVCAGPPFGDVGGDLTVVQVQAATDVPVAACEPRQGSESRGVADDAPAYVFFTSGTTGVPKAILGDHKGVAHFLAWQRTQFGVGSWDRCVSLTALSFDVILRDLFLPLTSGAVLCIPETDLDPTEVLGWMAGEEITTAHLVPSLVKSWLTTAPAVSLPSLRLSFFSGEPLTGELVRRWRSLLGAAARVVNLYGPTETTMAKYCYEIPAQVSDGVLPVGYPLPQTQGLVMRGDDHLCGVGEIGEVVLRTPFRTLGYLNEPGEQAKRFLLNPFRDDRGDMLYRTGDLGRYRWDGSLVVLGRVDAQVKLWGVRIEPDEVAAVLAQHPSVAACAVGVRTTGGGSMRLVAYVVTQSKEAVADALRTFLAERLPPAMVPGWFVWLDRLPLTANGKIDHKALVAMGVEERPEEMAYVAPRTDKENRIAAVWKEVLEVDRVGVHDNFFDLGGHSLLAIRLLVRLKSVFDVAVPLYAFFRAPTVAALADLLQQREVQAREVDDLGEILSRLERLSDEEAQRLLSGFS